MADACVGARWASLVYGENRRDHLQRGLDEFVEAGKYIAKHGIVVGGLQPENDCNHDRELNQGKSDQASYWS
jgi:hypothetical protein